MHDHGDKRSVAASIDRPMHRVISFAADQSSEVGTMRLEGKAQAIRLSRPPRSRRKT